MREGEAAAPFSSLPLRASGGQWHEWPPESAGVLHAHFTKDLQAGGGGRSEAPFNRKRHDRAGCSRTEEGPLRPGSGPGIRLALSLRGERRDKGHCSANWEFAPKRQCYCLFLVASTSARGQDQGSRPAEPGPCSAFLPARSSWGSGDSWVPTAKPEPREPPAKAFGL